MTLADAKALINCDLFNASQPQIWFDLGCGSGLFSEALIGLLPEGSLVYAIDKQPATFDSKEIKFLQLDFVSEPLPDLSVDGILMANSLHYVKDQLKFLTRIKTHLRTDGTFLLVEYDTETPNQWVPYPLGFQSAKVLFKQVGFETAGKINEMPSLFNNRSIYSAAFYDQKE